MASWADRRDDYLAQQQAYGRQDEERARMESERNALADILRRSYSQGTPEVPDRPYSEQDVGSGVGPLSMGQPIPGTGSPGTPGRFDMQNAIADLVQSRFAPEGLKLASEYDQNMLRAKQLNQLPGAVQETQWYLNQPETTRKAHEMLKRAPSVLNLGGTMMVRDPRGGVGESYKVTPKESEMPDFKGAQAGAEASAKAGVEMETDKTKKATKANTVLGYLDEANGLLDKATGSLAGTAYSMGKSAVGISDEKTQANQQLKLISGWLVANVPRMEGPQSNFDVKNYQIMAADVGNPTIPIGDRKAALSQLKKLQEKYASINAAPIAPTGNDKYNPSEKTSYKIGDTINRGGKLYIIKRLDPNGDHEIMLVK